MADESGVKVYSGGTMVSSAQVMDDQIIRSGGNDSMFVYSSGTANNTAISYHGNLFVSSGGTANNTTVDYIGKLKVSSGGTANSTTVNSSGIVYVISGGTATGTIVNSNGSMTVFSGGTANSTTVNSSGLFFLSSGAANNTTVSSCGKLYVHSGGAANNTTVNPGGYMYIVSGGKASGSLQITSGANVSARIGAIIDFTVAEQAAPATALINDWSLISDRNYVSYTITVKTDQESGTYRLAEGAADFAKTVTVKTTADEILGTLDVGSSLKTEYGNYTLNLTDGNLTLNAGPVIEEGSGVILKKVGNVISTAQVMNDQTLQYNGNDEMCVLSGGTANNTEVDSGGFLRVSDGGMANSTTVNFGGELHVFDGGTADSTIVNSFGFLYVSDGGTASSTTLNTGGVLYVSAGGMANSTTVSDGFLGVDAGGTASSTTIDTNGSMSVSSGGTANSTTINMGSMNVYIGGAASSTTINSGGKLHVYGGGTASGTTLNAGGGLLVSIGGTALAIKENGGYVVDFGGDNVTFVSNTFEGLVLNDQWATVHSGTTANNITIDTFGSMTVYSGGTADNTEVNFAGFLYVESGGTANNAAVNSSGLMIVSGGAVANNATVNYYGGLEISSGGTAHNTTVNSKGYLTVSSGGKISGSLQIARSFTVFPKIGAIIDFTVAEQAAPATALINNWSLIEGGNNADYTITVKTNQESGTYLLAAGAAEFERTVTVKTTADEILGTLDVGGSLKTEYGDYTLNLTDGNLTLNAGPVIEEKPYVILKKNGNVVSSAQVMNDQTLQYGGNDTMLVLSGGTANNTALRYCGNMFVSAGGTANSTTIYSGGYMLVSSGGTANNTTVCSGGNMFVSSGGTANSAIVSSGGYLYVERGGTADSAEIYSGGSMLVSSGGTANNAAVNYFGELSVSGGAANNTTVNSGGKLYVESGGTATGTTVNYAGGLHVSSGGTANNAEVNYCGFLYIRNGGKASGSLQITGGAIVSAYAGATIDFTVAEQADPATALINDWSLISGGSDASYTITVKTNQESGTYRLAEGAADFAKTVTVKTTADEILGTLDVGSSLKTEYGNYTLTKDAGVLSLSVDGATTPVIAKSDVDGNGVSDVVLQYIGGDYRIGYWMNGTDTWRDEEIGLSPEWEILGAYDMDNNGKADCVVRGNIQTESENGAYIGYYQDGDVAKWQNIDYLNNVSNVDWRLAIGNITGNKGANSIVWHAPELGALGVWTDGTSNWIRLQEGFGSGWEMQGCGDFDGNGKDEILFAYCGSFYTTDIDQNFVSLGGWGADWTVKAIGDFSGDGKDDLILQNGNMVVKFENGLAENWSSLGAIDSSDWAIVGAGDYNGDRKDDLLVRQDSTGMLSYYSSGDMDKWNYIGNGIDTNWAVIA